MGLFCGPVRVRPRRALTGLTIAFTSALADPAIQGSGLAITIRTRRIP